MARTRPDRVGSRHDLRAAAPRTRRTPTATQEPGRDFGWVHSYETGSTVDGPGVRINALHVGLPAALPVLPQSGYLAPKGRHRVELAQAVRRLADSRRCCGPWTAASRSRVASRWCRRLHRRHACGGQAHGPAYRARNLGLPRRARRRRLPRGTSTWCCSTSRAAIPRPTQGDRQELGADSALRRTPHRHGQSRSGSASCWCQASRTPANIEAWRVSSRR